MQQIVIRIRYWLSGQDPFSPLKLPFNIRHPNIELDF